ncbi:DUF1120 domain-containing protein [Enterobacter asburiae]|uniref:DUF1120 domain-containing protein n=1 Tax=Scandinavium sp. UTDF21-P1B TaxID=3446379 RepID=UPI00349167A1
MNKLTKLAAATLLAAVAGQAMAVDDNVDVKVTGQIVPPACIPAMSGGAVFDYGGIKAASLNSDDFNVLGEKTLNFSVACESPTKMAFKVTDARKGTAVLPVGKRMQQRTIATDTALSGLGTEDGKNIGAYSLNIAKLTIDKGDGSPVIALNSLDSIRSEDNGQTWTKLTTDTYTRVYLDDDGRLFSLAEKGSLEPLSVKVMNGTMWAQVAINKGSELNLTKINNLDGQSNIQIIYL